MLIEQFEDKYLSHYSYAILDEETRQVVLIDPARNPQAYIDFADKNSAKITAVIETHPHADFVSCHLEIHQKTGADIYASKLTGAFYPHKTFDDGDEISIGKISFKAINTPGHSPDSISILVEDSGKQHALFTGDTLFIGDCGRPDLRETAGEITLKREELAAMMFDSLHTKLKNIPDDVLIYPSHGAGTLCGKALSSANSSTMGAERMGNWSLSAQNKESFVEELLSGQPLVPAYFGYDVELNRKGAGPFLTSINAVDIQPQPDVLDPPIVVIDARPQKLFKTSHLHNSINLMNETKFETWLGTIIEPETPFYLTADNETTLQKLIERTASIGYEKFISAAFVFEKGNERMAFLDEEDFSHNCRNYTIVDIRNKGEREQKLLFQSSMHIPLSELSKRWSEIPVNKPVVIHCAAGFRSAAGSSLLQSKLQVPVYDLGENVKKYLLNKEAVQC